MGKEAIRLLRYALRMQGEWCVLTFSDRKITNAIATLERNGLIIVSENRRSYKVNTEHSYILV